jgi:hypothetical protein
LGVLIFGGIRFVQTRPQYGRIDWVNKVSRLNQIRKELGDQLFQNRK